MSSRFDFNVTWSTSNILLLTSPFDYSFYQVLNVDMLPIDKCIVGMVCIIRLIDSFWVIKVRSISDAGSIKMLFWPCCRKLRKEKVVNFR